MNPSLPPLDTSGPLPDGWTTEQAGQWQGHEVEVVYDPRRHDVMLVPGPAADDADGGLAQIGYEFVARRPIVALVPRPTRRRPQHAGASTRRLCNRGQGARALTMPERFSPFGLQGSLERRFGVGDAPADGRVATADRTHALRPEAGFLEFNGLADTFGGPPP